MGSTSTVESGLTHPEVPGSNPGLPFVALGISRLMSAGTNQASGRAGGKPARKERKNESKETEHAKTASEEALEDA